jgi:class 3 adenylate cyclase
MMDQAKKTIWGSENEPVVLKIGIHYGRIMAGVIGHHKP